MSVEVSFTLRGRNPDVLTCIANLSNDEVFTPPEFANRIGNLEFMPMTLNGRKSHTMGARQLSHLRKLREAR